MHSYTALICLLLACAVSADMYMHNPRGSNGRYDGQNANRENGARLMDTQNNAKGGYCWGPTMDFYERSIMSMEWTNQHACGQSKTNCDVILQYTCSDADAAGNLQVRDGKTTTTIPNDADDYLTTDGTEGTYLYGMHENFVYYQECQERMRNTGLFIADRNLGNDRAVNTRQNNNGNRNGFECPEERDYYPYFHPSPWRDIAVLTGKTSNCDMYKKESQNVKPKFRCVDPAVNPDNGIDGGTAYYFNTEQQCLANAGVWERTAAWGIDEPDCQRAPWSRQNHLGNGQDGYANNYNWTLPSLDDEKCIKNEAGCSCVVRMRYNISTDDYDGWKTDAAANGALSPVMNDPYVDILGVNLSLAIDTSQFGRTFQDRSHVFNVRERPDGVSSNARIFNLNVRGKRGNIVQTYPATEYDFVPQVLTVRSNDYVHMQWTGCDNNPAGNAGEGTSQTDRSNIVQMDGPGKSYPAENPSTWLFEKEEQRLYFAYAGQDIANCPTLQELRDENDDDDDAVEEDVDNCMKLNAAPQLFNGGLVQLAKADTYYYMSSRNNNYTNRGQKGVIIVAPLLPTWAIVVVSIAGAAFLAAAGVFGAMLYARKNPHSQVAEYFDRF